MGAKTGGYPGPGEREAEWNPKYQGKEFVTTIQAPDEATLEDMLTDLSDYAMSHEMDAIQVLSKGPDPDGGYRAVVQAHNTNPFTYIREKWSGRGGGLEARIKKEQEERERKLKESKLRAEATKEKARQEKERATIEAERATAETELWGQRVLTRKSVQERREAARKRRKEELAMRLETFEEAVRRTGGFAGAQAATFETALYTPSLFAEEATTPVRPRRLRRPLLEDILDSRMP